MSKQSKFQLIRNVVNSALVPGRLPTMLRMIWRERFPEDGSFEHEKNFRWLRENKLDFETIAKRNSPDLWRETEEFLVDFNGRSEKSIVDIEQTLGYHLGGGGYYPLLYFLTRKFAPDVIVETGVAAGFSSQGFLSAIKANGRGRLYSSDFPYFRLKDAEKYIGIIVEDKLRKNWDLFIEGDEKNLRKILNIVEKIDIFHYDSDKSYEGRRLALSLIDEKLDENSFLIMDDIQDNSFFHDYVLKNAKDNWMVFEFENKFVGVVGPVGKLL